MTKQEQLSARFFVESIKINAKYVKPIDYEASMAEYTSFVDYLLYVIEENDLKFADWAHGIANNTLLIIAMAKKKPTIFREIRETNKDLYFAILKYIAANEDISTYPFIIKHDLAKLHIKPQKTDDNKTDDEDSVTGNI